MECCEVLGSYERVFGVLALALLAGAVAVALATRERRPVSRAGRR